MRIALGENGSFGKRRKTVSWDYQQLPLLLLHYLAFVFLLAKVTVLLYLIPVS